MSRLFLFLFSLISLPCFSQDWKVYADSADKLKGSEPKKAIQYYLKAENLLSKDSLNTATYASCLSNIGMLYKRMSVYQQATALLLKSKSINELVFGKEHFYYAVSCYNLADLYTELAQYRNAEELYLEVMPIIAKVNGKENDIFASVCSNLALTYFLKGDYEKAEVLYIESKAINEKVFGQKHISYATACNNLAQLYYYLGKNTKANLLFSEARKIVVKTLGRKHPLYDSLYNSFGRVYLEWGEYKLAETIFIESKDTVEKLYGKQHVRYAACCNNLAIVFRETGRYEKAESLFLEAKLIRAKIFGTGNVDYAASCNDLAKLYYYIGEYEKAEPLFLEAKSVRGNTLGKYNIEYAATCSNIAELYSDIGQYEKALLLFLEAKSIIAKTLGKEHLRYAASSNMLARFYLKIGQYDKAEPIFKYSKAVVAKSVGKINQNYAQVCKDLAILYEKMKQYDKAVILMLESKEILTKLLGKENSDYAAICNKLGNLYTLAGEYKKAELLLNEAILLNEIYLGKEHPTYATSCGDLAKLYWKLDRPSMATPLFQTQFNAEYLQIKKIFQFTSEKEKENYFKNIVNGNNIYYSFYYSQKNSIAPFVISSLFRNLILSASQHFRKTINNSDSSILNMYQQWIEIKKQLSILVLNDEKGINYTKDLIDSSNLLEKKLIAVSASFKEQEEQIHYQTIKNKLKADEAAIEFVEFKYYTGKAWTDSIFYIALLLKKENPEPIMLRLFEKKQLDSLLMQTGNSVVNKNVKGLYASRGVIVGNNAKMNHSIYELIWKPLESDLQGIKTIYFAPTGLLHRIAFAALPLNNKEVLGDQVRLVQLNSIASIINQQSYVIDTTDKIILYGDISYTAETGALKKAALGYQISKPVTRSLYDGLIRGGNWNELPGTKIEVEAIRAIGRKNKISVSVFSRIKANEESIKALDGKNSPAILHIATHGFFFPDPKENNEDSTENEQLKSGKAFRTSNDPLFRSGLLFAGANTAWNGKNIDGIEDGTLTAYEVSNMYLPNTKLVVLSACETGLGDIQGAEGVYGLQRAFKMAGVRSLIMSLWKVPDAETAEFMEEFYKNLLSKKSIADAFLNTQAKLKNKYREAPYKWAAWILVQ